MSNKAIIENNPSICVSKVLSANEIRQRNKCNDFVHTDAGIIERIFPSLPHKAWKVGRVNEISKYSDHYLFTFLLMHCGN